MKKIIMIITLFFMSINLFGCNTTGINANEKTEGDYLRTFLIDDSFKDYREEFDVYFVEETEESYIIEFDGEFCLNNETIKVCQKFTFTQIDENYWLSNYEDYEIKIYRSTTAAIYGDINFIELDGYEYLGYVKNLN